MLFNSMTFAFFLPVVFILYWIVPKEKQWQVIMIASCIFYMSWNPKYIILIAVTVIASYACAICIVKYAGFKRLFLALAVIICMSLLVIFKYFQFLLETIRLAFSESSIPLISIVLPVGISFYTFQTMSYVIDVYKEKVKPEYHLGIYTAFIMFFPQLVAGPIERAENLLPQIRKKHEFNYNSAVNGIKLMTWGYFKKLVIADNLATHVDIVYNNIDSYTGLALVVATVFFAFQIYCDFSGYSDIARGVAGLFDIHLMKNFDSPYFSSSLKEFWSRWHISLSTWFRDYVYIPWGGSRRGNVRKHLNLIGTFIVSGLWHGANWTFAIWGMLHGLLQSFEYIYQDLRKKFKEKRNIKWLLVIETFCLVCICWVFFRAASVNDAIYIFRHSLDGVAKPFDYIYKGYHDLQLDKVKVVTYGVALSLLFAYDFYSLKGDVIYRVSQLSKPKRWIVYYSLLLFIILTGNFGSNQFVYFQF